MLAQFFAANRRAAAPRPEVIDQRASDGLLVYIEIARVAAGIAKHLRPQKPRLIARLLVKSATLVSNCRCSVD